MAVYSKEGFDIIDQTNKIDVENYLKEHNKDPIIHSKEQLEKLIKQNDDPKKEIYQRMSRELQDSMKKRNKFQQDQQTKKKKLINTIAKNMGQQQQQQQQSPQQSQQQR